MEGSDAKVSDRCLIDVDSGVFAVWDARGIGIRKYILITIANF